MKTLLIIGVCVVVAVLAWPFLKSLVGAIIEITTGEGWH
jgi:hypothetical protein